MGASSGIQTCKQLTNFTLKNNIFGRSTNLLRRDRPALYRDSASSLESRPRKSFDLDLAKLPNMEDERLKELLRIQQFIAIKTKKTQIRQIGKDPFELIILDDDSVESSTS